MILYITVHSSAKWVIVRGGEDHLWLVSHIDRVVNVGASEFPRRQSVADRRRLLSSLWLFSFSPWKMNIVSYILIVWFSMNNEMPKCVFKHNIGYKWLTTIHSKIPHKALGVEKLVWTKHTKKSYNNRFILESLFTYKQKKHSWENFKWIITNYNIIKLVDKHTDLKIEFIIAAPIN